MDNAYRLELLKTGLTARIREITEYQVNIDNFKLAIKAIGEDGELQPFKAHLVELLASSELEQRKAQLIFDVIKTQLEPSNA